MRKSKLKPVDIFEVENIAKADIFIINEFNKGQLIDKFQTTSFPMAEEYALSPNFLVYAYNKRSEEIGGASRCILLTEYNLKLYAEWLNKDL